MISDYTAELGEQDEPHSQYRERLGMCLIDHVRKVFGGWGNEAQKTFSRVAKKLATRTSHFWAEVLASIYCYMGITLMLGLCLEEEIQVDICLV